MAKSTFDELNAIAEEAAAEYRKKTEGAIKKIKSNIKVEMQRIIDEDALDNYYEGYDPQYYKRQKENGGLPNSLGPYVESLSDNNGTTLSFGVDDRPPYGPGAMKHKKRGKSKRRIPPDENKIFENFMDGIHPNANPAFYTSTPTEPVKEKVLASIDDYYDHKVEGMIKSELSKI